MLKACKPNATNADASSWFDIPKTPHSSLNLSNLNFFNFFFCIYEIFIDGNSSINILLPFFIKLK